MQMKDSTHGLAIALFDAQVARENAENAHRSQPGANLFDAYRVLRALRGAR